MARGQFTDGDSQYAALFGVGGLIDDLKADTRLPHSLAAQLTADATTIRARTPTIYVMQDECGRLVQALKHVVSKKQV